MKNTLSGKSPHYKDYFNVYFNGMLVLPSDYDYYMGYIIPYPQGGGVRQNTYYDIINRLTNQRSYGTVSPGEMMKIKAP